MEAASDILASEGFLHITTLPSICRRRSQSVDSGESLHLSLWRPKVPSQHRGPHRRVKWNAVREEITFEVESEVLLVRQVKSLGNPILEIGFFSRRLSSKEAFETDIL